MNKYQIAYLYEGEPSQWMLDNCILYDESGNVTTSTINVTHYSLSESITELPEGAFVMSPPSGPARIELPNHITHVRDLAINPTLGSMPDDGTRLLNIPSNLYYSSESAFTYCSLIKDGTPINISLNNVSNIESLPEEISYEGPSENRPTLIISGENYNLSSYSLIGNYNVYILGSISTLNLSNSNFNEISNLYLTSDISTYNGLGNFTITTGNEKIYPVPFTVGSAQKLVDMFTSSGETNLIPLIQYPQEISIDYLSLPNEPVFGMNSKFFPISVSDAIYTNESDNSTGKNKNLTTKLTEITNSIDSKSIFENGTTSFTVGGITTGTNVSGMSIKEILIAVLGIN